MTDQRVLPEAMAWFLRQNRWPNDVMYHYTSREALESILTSRRMRATDLRAMNDPEELSYSKALIDGRIGTETKRTSNPLAQMWLRNVQAQFHKLFAASSSSFSISFCEHADLAHQWREYGLGGRGFALGWSIDSRYPEKPLQMWVTYDWRKQAAIVDGLIDLHLRHIDHAAASDASAFEAAIRSGLSLAIFLDVLLQNFKRAKWADESEFRYVYQFFDGYIPAGTAFNTRVAGGREKRYIDADFSKAALRRIIVGPKNDIESTGRWLRDLLQRCGFDETEVFASTANID